MLSYFDYLVFLQAAFSTEQLYWFRRIIFSMFLRKKKLKITCPFCKGRRLTKIFKMLSYLDYLVFLHAFFCTEQLSWFRRVIFVMISGSICKDMRSTRGLEAMMD